MAIIFVKIPGKDVMPFEATVSVESVEKSVRNVHMLEGGGLRERDNGHFVDEGYILKVGETYDFVGGVARGK